MDVWPTPYNIIIVPVPSHHASPLLVITIGLNSANLCEMSINISKDYWDCYGLFIIMEIYGLLLVMFPSDLSLDWSPHPWGRYEGGIKVGYKGVRIVFFNRFDCRWSCEAVISLRMIHLLRLSTELNIFMCEVGCYRKRSAESVLSRSVGLGFITINNAINSPVVRLYSEDVGIT